MKKSLLFLFGLLLFSNAVFADYTPSPVYEKSVDRHFDNMTRACAFEPKFSGLSKLNDDGREELFLMMYDITNSFLSSDLSDAEEVFGVQTEWQLTKSYKDMDFAEYILVKGPDELLVKIIQYGKSIGSDINDVISDKDNISM